MKTTHLTSRTGYNLHARFYDQKTGYLTSFEKQALFDLLDKNLSNKKILDAGAGTGRIIPELIKRNARVTALDISEEMLKICQKKNPRVETIIGDVENMPFFDNNFDIVIATFLIVHLKNPKYFFEESYRILKPGGRLIITNINQKRPPEIPSYQGPITIESYYHRPESIIDILESLAFDIETNHFIHESDTWINQIIEAVK